MNILPLVLFAAISVVGILFVTFNINMWLAVGVAVSIPLLILIYKLVSEKVPAVKVAFKFLGGIFWASSFIGGITSIIWGWLEPEITYELVTVLPSGEPIFKTHSHFGSSASSGLMSLVGSLVILGFIMFKVSKNKKPQEETTANKKKNIIFYVLSSVAGILIVVLVAYINEIPYIQFNRLVESGSYSELDSFDSYFEKSDFLKRIQRESSIYMEKYQEKDDVVSAIAFYEALSDVYGDDFPINVKKSYIDWIVAGCIEKGEIDGDYLIVIDKNKGDDYAYYIKPYYSHITIKRIAEDEKTVTYSLFNHSNNYSSQKDEGIGNKKDYSKIRSEAEKIYNERLKKIEGNEQQKLLAVEYEKATKLFEEGKKVEAAMAFGRAYGYSDAFEKSMELWNEIVVRNTFYADEKNLIAIKNDGSILCVTDNTNDKKYDFSGWENIIDITVGSSFVAGLKADGTVIVNGFLYLKDEKSENANNWENVVKISGTGRHLIALKADGTAVAAGENDNGQCNVSSWSNIIDVSAGGNHSVGLKLDGTVVAEGNNYFGQCDVGNWSNIVSIDAGYDHTVAIKSNGTVVANEYKGSLDNYYGECEVDGWKDVVYVCASDSSTVAIKKDGTVISCGFVKFINESLQKWTDIVIVSSNYNSFVAGVKSNGTIVTAGYAGHKTYDDVTDIMIYR